MARLRGNANRSESRPHLFDRLLFTHRASRTVPRLQMFFKQILSYPNSSSDQGTEQPIVTSGWNGPHPVRAQPAFSPSRRHPAQRRPDNTQAKDQCERFPAPGWSGLTSHLASDSLRPGDKSQIQRFMLHFCPELQGTHSRACQSDIC